VIARRIVVRGRVQGVGFRYAALEVAQVAGVAGWVRNRRDGTVEALVQGDPPAVETVVAWCRHGPPAARVTGVDVAEAPPDPSCASFALRATA
jgi:acylphosphatase